jgi:hypothetical protein
VRSLGAGSLRKHGNFPSVCSSSSARFCPVPYARKPDARLAGMAVGTASLKSRESSSTSATIESRWSIGQGGMAHLPEIQGLGRAVAVDASDVQTGGPCAAANEEDHVLRMWKRIGRTLVALFIWGCGRISRLHPVYVTVVKRRLHSRAEPGDWSRVQVSHR